MMTWGAQKIAGNSRKHAAIRKFQKDIFSLQLIKYGGLGEGQFEGLGSSPNLDQLAEVFQDQKYPLVSSSVPCNP